MSIKAPTEIDEVLTKHLGHPVTISNIGRRDGSVSLFCLSCQRDLIVTSGSVENRVAGAECTCQYPEVVARNMNGHAPDCPVYIKWAEQTYGIADDSELRVTGSAEPIEIFREPGLE